jgi:hypothetical protein
METKYGALRTISVIYKILGILVLAGTVLAFLASLLGASSLNYGYGFNLGGIFGALLVLIPGLILAVSLYAFANLIDLLLATEENTRSTAYLLAELVKQNRR